MMTNNASPRRPVDHVDTVIVREIAPGRYAAPNARGWTSWVGDATWYTTERQLRAIGRLRAKYARSGARRRYSGDFVRFADIDGMWKRVAVLDI